MGLVGRRPLAYSLAAIAMLAVFLAAVEVDLGAGRWLLALALPPLATAGFLRLAQAADHSVELEATALLPTNKDALRILALTVAGYALVFAAASLLRGADAVLLAGQGEPSALHLGWRALVVRIAGGLGLPPTLLLHSAVYGASITAFAGLLLILGSWFTLPLTQFAGLSLVPATLLSWRALRLNVRCFGIGTVAVLIVALVCLLASFGVAAILAAPFLGSMLYVSYRDVFLGRAQNAPAPVRRRVARAAEASL